MRTDAFEIIRMPDGLFRKEFSKKIMSLQELSSQQFAGLSLVVEPSASDARQAWIASNIAPSMPLIDRILTGISGPMLSATLRRIGDLSNSAYGDDLFAFNLYSKILDRSSALRVRRREQGLLSLEQRKRKLGKLFQGMSMLGEDSFQIVVPSDEIEQFAWSYFFPTIPYHGNVDVTSKPMRDLRNDVFREWKRCEEQSGIDRSSLSSIIEKHFVSEKTPGLASLFHAWRAYSLHQVPQLVLETAIDIASSVHVKLTDPARECLRILYGPHSLFGGASMFFAARTLQANDALQKDILDMLDSVPMPGKGGMEYARANASMRLAMLIYANLDVQELDRERKRHARSLESVPLDSVQPTAPADEGPRLDSELLVFIKRWIMSLPAQDQLLLNSHFEGWKPREIVARNPGILMDEKKVSDRIRYLKAKLKEDAHRDFPGEHSLLESQ